MNKIIQLQPWRALEAALTRYKATLRFPDGRVLGSKR